MSTFAERQAATKERIKRMLTENTGRHMLDSGGAYGRHWERNRTRDFDAEPEFFLHVGDFGNPPRLYMDLSLNIYHWLADRIEYDVELENLMERFVYETDAHEIAEHLLTTTDVDTAEGVRLLHLYYYLCKRLFKEPRVQTIHCGDIALTVLVDLKAKWDEDVLAELDAYAQELASAPGYTFQKNTNCFEFAGGFPAYHAGHYFPSWSDKEEDLRESLSGPNGGGEPWIINTCNEEDSVSQVMQYVAYEIDGDEFVCLQIHNGCDVRGGYTMPVPFWHLSDYKIWDNAHVVAYCENRHIWDTYDGGYCWERIEQWEPDEDMTICRTSLGDGTPVMPDQWEVGKLALDPETQTAYCPVCKAPLKFGW